MYFKTESGVITSAALIFVSGTESKVTNLSLAAKRRLWICFRELRAASSVSRTSGGFSLLILDGLGMEMLQGQTAPLTFDPLDIKIRSPSFSERAVTKGGKVDMSLTLDFEARPDISANTLRITFPDTFWYSGEVIGQVGLAPGYLARMKNANVLELSLGASSSSELITSQTVTLLFRNVL